MGISGTNNQAPMKGITVLRILFSCRKSRKTYHSSGQPGIAASISSIKRIVSERVHPLLFNSQIVRALLWAACAPTIISGSKIKPWATVVLVGMLFSVPLKICQSSLTRTSPWPACG